MTLSTTAIVQRSQRRQSRRRLTSPAVVISLLWLAGLVVASLTAPLWLPYGPLDQDLSAVLQGPSAAHILGTDELGRDLGARIISAAAPTLAIALLTPIVAIGVTIPITLWASRRRAAETTLNRVSEIVLSLPGTVIILAVIAAVGTNMAVVMAIFGLLLFGALYKIFFGQAKSLQQRLFVEAAAVDGVRPFVASLRHVLPNMATTVVVQFVLLFGVAIGLQAGLAFIGLGPQPPEPTWGGMIQAASQFIFQQPWLMVPTGGVLALTIIAANALANSLAGGAATPPPLISLRRRPARAMRTDVSVPDLITADVAALGMSGTAEIPAAAALVPPSMELDVTPDPGTATPTIVKGAAAVEADAPFLPRAEAAKDGGLAVERLVIVVDDGPALVSGVSLRVRAGTVLGLVGESGSGKSVTSYAILGLLAPGLSVRSGRISWDGKDLATASERTMQEVRGHEIAFVSQEPTRALDPMFTIGSQLVSAVRRLRGSDREQAKRISEQLLADVGIVDPPRVLRSYPHQISGGMAQRVVIALALAGTPRLLIADEPTTALDVTVQAEILDLLRRLVEERGMSVLLVTHDFGVVADLCDDVAVMYKGEVVETGTVRDVLLRPMHPYTKTLLASGAFTEEPPAGIAGVDHRGEHDDTVG